MVSRQNERAYWEHLEDCNRCFPAAQKIFQSFLSASILNNPSTPRDYSIYHLCLQTHWIFEVSVDGLLRIRVIRLEKNRSQLCRAIRRRSKVFTDFQEPDGLLAASTCEADEVDDSFLRRF